MVSKGLDPADDIYTRPLGVDNWIVTMPYFTRFTAIVCIYSLFLEREVSDYYCIRVISGVILPFSVLLTLLYGAKCTFVGLSLCVYCSLPSFNSYVIRD